MLTQCCLTWSTKTSSCQALWRLFFFFFLYLSHEPWDWCRLGVVVGLFCCTWRPVCSRALKETLTVGSLSFGLPTLFLRPQRSPLSALQNLICCEMQKGFQNNRMTDSEKSISLPFCGPLVFCFALQTSWMRTFCLIFWKCRMCKQYCWFYIGFTATYILVLQLTLFCTA